MSTDRSFVWLSDPPEKGEIVARVWYCDDDCQCTEAQIIHVIQRNQFGGWGQARTLWTGDYHAEGEQGADHDLNRAARAIKKADRELFHRIRWPWTYKEGAPL